MPNGLDIPALRRRSAAGSAMSEMVLVMPFLLFILALIVYFGRDMVRVQRALVADRYETWRRVGRGSELGSGQLNSMFFGGRAARVDPVESAGFPDGAQARLIDATAGRAPETAALTQALFDAMPDGLEVRVEVDHVNRTPFWRRFTGPIVHRHLRLEHEWRYANGWRRLAAQGWRDSSFEGFERYAWLDRSAFFPNWRAWPDHGDWYPATPTASNLSVVTGTFFGDLERALADLATAPSAVPMVNMMRGLYLVRSPYVGPSVDFAESSQ